MKVLYSLKLLKTWYVCDMPFKFVCEKELSVFCINISGFLICLCFNNNIKAFRLF